MSDEFVFTEEQSSYRVNTVLVEDFVKDIEQHDDFVVEIQEEDFIVDADGPNEYQMWQGMTGPYYYPNLDILGNLSWTNNGGLPNPAPVNIQGKGLTIVGMAETTGDLPPTADEYDVYLVGSASPYHGYIYANSTWTDLGEIGVGEAAGFGTPTATVNGTTGIPSVTVTATGPDTAKVFAFAFKNLKGEDGTDGRDGTDGVGVPQGGTTGQMLVKHSATDYDTEWEDPLALGSANPVMDGTAAPGSASAAAHEDHVHPHDTSKQDTLVSGTNIKTINGNSLLGSGDVSLSDFLVVEAKSADNISISSTSYADGTISVAKSGYTPIGIVGWRIQNATSSGQYYARIFAWRLELSESTLYYGLSNYYSATAKIKLTANVLYRKN